MHSMILGAECMLRKPRSKASHGGHTYQDLLANQPADTSNLRDKGEAVCMQMPHPDPIQTSTIKNAGGSD